MEEYRNKLFDYIVGCFTSSGKYFMNIHDENKFNKIQKLYRNEIGMAGPGQQLLTTTGKIWKLDRDENLAFCSGYIMHQHFFKFHKSGLLSAEHGTL